ncbi:hypothetical protein AX774_g7648 [Zancudomyces culisetae]|uniref:Uncharacterized protein n=1 Tax=Zancudomyces culisetae TaxID=1213189 RepID=A0A1R1PD73_ZANCU|nr:hypothetical protein AX774_g7648 [Zancudomyces culisetae]|eukprot:OMH78945.1 hypothetical protein AX774_g7648 [Zancudomyces culisetae]
MAFPSETLNCTSQYSFPLRYVVNLHICKTLTSWYTLPNLNPVVATKSSNQPCSNIFDIASDTCLFFVCHPYYFAVLVDFITPFFVSAEI